MGFPTTIPKTKTCKEGEKSPDSDFLVKQIEILRYLSGFYGI